MIHGGQSRTRLARWTAILAILLCGVAAAQDAELRGDLNADGTLNSLDSILLKQLVLDYKNHRRDPAYEIPLGADLNGNDKLGVKDTRILNRLVKNYVPPQPVLKLSASPLPGPQGAVPITASPLHMGTNLTMVNYYSPEWVFTDALKQSMPWASMNRKTWQWFDGRTIQLRPEDGALLLQADQAACTIIYRNIGGHYPAGDYICSWEGTGKIDFQFDAKKVSATDHRAVARVTTTSNSGIGLRVDESDPADPVRNIRLWLPGFENSTQTFHPLFLERLQGYKHLRFIDWQRTINSNTTDWSQRTLASRTQDNPAGVSVETMVELCNTLDTDGWFHIPHQANDAWVTQFATYLRDHLEPGRLIYLEYSNETWNNQYTETKYVMDQGQALGLSANRFEAGRRFHAKRSREIFKIFEQVFAGRDRFVRLLAGQAADHFASEKMLAWEESYKEIDALAIAPYFAANGIEARMPGATVDDVLELCENYIRSKVIDVITLQKNVAEKYGLRLVSYEGGQHLTQANSPELTALFIEANRDPRMYDLYTLYFNTWAAHNGAEPFTHYTNIYQPNKFGSWGSLEYQDQPIDAAHKFRAVRDAMAGKLPFLETGTAQLTSLGVFD